MKDRVRRASHRVILATGAAVACTLGAWPASAFAALLLAASPTPARAAPQDTTRAAGMNMMMMSMDSVRGSGDMIVPMIRNPMLPGLRGVSPSVDPFFPGEGVDTATLSWATPREVLEVADGDTIALDARIVKRKIGGRVFVMYGFNGQYPGPLLRVAQHSRIVVRFTNSIDLPSTIHWHGIRLENRFDGVPGVTQDAVLPGETFVYEIVFPDAGLYWYHPHVREDIQQDGGLYGNMMVDPEREDYFGPASREEFIMVDDLLVDGDELLPYGRDAANFTIMGRFGNVMLVNGEERYGLTVRSGRGGTLLRHQRVEHAHVQPEFRRPRDEAGGHRSVAIPARDDGGVAGHRAGRAVRRRGALPGGRHLRAPQPGTGGGPHARRVLRGGRHPGSSHRDRGP